MRDILSKIKKATVAIAVMNKNETSRLMPFHIMGTGFFINNKGCTVTAYHVLKKAIYFNEIYNKRKSEAELVILHYSRIGSSFKVNSIPFYKTSPTNFEAYSGYVGPKNLDIGMGIPNPEEEIRDTPYLPIKKPSKLNLFSQVCMCGYPGGEQTMDLTKKYTGLRFSPVIQFGRMTGFMPVDEIEVPYGIQTDIVGTGGSSGSPLVDLSSGEVIAVAQQVLVSEVNGSFKFSNHPNVSRNFRLEAETSIGLVHGINMQLFYDLYLKSKNNIFGNKIVGSLRLSRFKLAKD